MNSAQQSQEQQQTGSRKQYSRLPAVMTFMDRVYFGVNFWPEYPAPPLPNKIYIPFVHSSIKDCIGFIVQEQIMLGTVTNIEFIERPLIGSPSAILTMGKWTANDTSIACYNGFKADGEYRVNYGTSTHYFTLQPYKPYKEPLPFRPVVTRYDSFVLTSINDYVCEGQCVHGFMYPAHSQQLLPLSVYIPFIPVGIKNKFASFIQDDCNLGIVHRVDFIEKANGKTAAFLHMKAWFVNDIVEACGLIFDQADEIKLHYTNTRTNVTMYITFKQMICDPVPDSSSGLNVAQLEEIIREKDELIATLKKQIEYETVDSDCVATQSKCERMRQEMMFMADKLVEIINQQADTLAR